jgi:hypothetical protein
MGLDLITAKAISPMLISFILLNSMDVDRRMAKVPDLTP